MQLKCLRCCLQAFAAVQSSVVHLQGVPVSQRFALVPLGPPLLTYSPTAKVGLRGIARRMHYHSLQGSSQLGMYMVHEQHAFKLHNLGSGAPDQRVQNMSLKFSCFRSRNHSIRRRP